MDKLESLQKELGQFLIEMIPVEWKKICFYSECSTGRCSAWFAFVERKTDVICTQDFFGKRYDSYPIKKTDVYLKLTDFSLALNKAYIEKYGADKAWHSLSYTITDDYKYHIDFSYEEKDVSVIKTHTAVYESFFNTPYKFINTKYPY